MGPRKEGFLEAVQASDRESPFEILWNGRPASLDERSRYKHLRVLFMTKHITPLANDRNTRDRDIDSVLSSLPVNIWDEVNSYAGPFYRCVGDKKSVELSIKKLDFPICKEYKQHFHWNTTREVVEAMWAFRFKDARFTPLEELLPDMNLDSAAGVPWRLIGLKQKRDVFQSVFMFLILSYFIIEQKRPIWSLSPKTEWYNATDLDNGKVRTFIIPPFHLLLWGLMLYKSQNELTKDYWWSAYGYCPYRGGTHRAALKLLVLAIFFVTYDVKGWDRRFPMMKMIYKFRNIHIDQDFRAYGEWVKDNIVTSLILLPDGTVVEKSIGNNSGSWATTGDNILGHHYPLFLTLMVIYDGDVDTVLDICAMLYGDDNVMGLPKIPTHIYSGDNPEEFIENCFRTTFALFGFELDPFCCTRTLEGHEFLGFKFTLFEDYWIPQYNIGRIGAAFCYTIKKMPDNAIVSRCWSLMVMAAGSGETAYHAFASAMEWILLSFADSEDPVIQSYVDVGVPSFEQVMRFYTGLESSFELPPFNFLEVGGRNSLLFDVEQCQEAKTCQEAGKKKTKPPPTRANNASCGGSSAKQTHA